MYILGDCYLSLGRDDGSPGLPAAGAWTAIRPQATGNRQAVTLKSLASVQARHGLVAQARGSWARAAAIFDDLGDSAQAAQARAEQDGIRHFLRFP